MPAHVSISRADGGVSIMLVTAEEVTDEAILAELAAVSAHEFDNEAEGDVPARRNPLHGYTGWRRIDPSELPNDRTFREAWTDTGKAVGIDMRKARDIHRGRLRAMRAPMLAALDIDYQRADEQGDTASKKRIAARKQALRDATKAPEIEAAETPEALARVMPEALRA